MLVRCDGRVYSIPTDLLNELFDQHANLEPHGMEMTVKIKALSKKKKQP